MGPGGRPLASKRPAESGLRDVALQFKEPKAVEAQQGWQGVVLLCGLGIMISYADRSNISIAIIGMAKDFEWDKAPLLEPTLATRGL